MIFSSQESSYPGIEVVLSPQLDQVQPLFIRQLLMGTLTKETQEKGPEIHANNYTVSAIGRKTGPTL